MKVSAVGGTSIVYNSAGAFTSYGSTAYNWNATGQISFISTSGSTVGTYTYNASNQRTKKVAGGNTTHYVYGLGGLLYGEYDGSGALIREYVYQNDAPLAQIDAGSPEVLTYLHTDHLGTPKYGTNAVGTSVWSANTDPFGVGTPSGSRTVNLRMAGQYYDSESGLFYNWNRYYHPALGRYISSDPIGLEGGPNTFNYASINPLMYTDPRGLTADCPSRLTGVSAAMCYENGAAEGFVEYGGNSSVYHCGGSTFLEYRSDTSTAVDDPVGECVYDVTGGLIDDGHPYRGCQGTPDHYPYYGLSSGISMGLDHMNKDPGGPNGRLPNGQTLGQAAREESNRFSRDFADDPDSVEALLRAYDMDLLPEQNMTPIPFRGQSMP